MRKKILIGSMAAIAVASMPLMNKAFAATDNSYNSGNFSHARMMKRMSSFNQEDLRQMNEAHRLMNEGKYEEAYSIMDELGMDDCPMVKNGKGNSGTRNNRNSEARINRSGMMGNYGVSMM